MFSFAVENANYPTYFTEKLTDCFACGTIPVYYGTAGVAQYFNPEGIIFLDEKNIGKIFLGINSHLSIMNPRKM